MAAPRASIEEALCAFAPLCEAPPVFRIKRLTHRLLSRNSRASLSNYMGKQYNKVEKRRRRMAYLERKKAKAKAGAAASKPKAKKPAARKKAEA